MDEKDKDLLLKDICGRLLYGVKTSYSGYEMTIRGVDVESKTVDVIDWGKVRFAAVRIEKIKPYLRPMSTMTEEEKKEYIEYAGYEIEESVNGRHYEYYLKDFCGTPNNPSVNADGVDWLNKKMFDYRGLIPAGLANVAPDGMYNS